MAKILDIENTKNFNVCFILSPHDFIYVKFQLPIYCQRKNLYVIKILHVRVSLKSFMNLKSDQFRRICNWMPGFCLLNVFVPTLPHTAMFLCMPICKTIHRKYNMSDFFKTIRCFYTFSWVWCMFYFEENWLLYTAQYLFIRILQVTKRWHLTFWELTSGQILCITCCVCDYYHHLLSFIHWILGYAL